MSSESDPLSQEEKNQIIDDIVSERMQIYDELISKQELEYSSNLFEIAHTNCIFWQQVYFDWFNL
jgi:shikimate kinase